MTPPLNIVYFKQSHDKRHHLLSAMRHTFNVFTRTFGWISINYDNWAFLGLDNTLELNRRQIIIQIIDNDPLLRYILQCDNNDDDDDDDDDNNNNNNDNIYIYIFLFIYEHIHMHIYSKLGIFVDVIPDQTHSVGDITSKSTAVTTYTTMSCSNTSI